MIRLLIAVLGVAFVSSNGSAEVKRWRVGDEVHPWTLRPVTGRLDLGRSWAVELIADDDGDGRIDEDPVELIDNDDDALINEDPADEQVDNDGDGQLNEDPANGRDDDGDGLVDEDPVERIDNDLDGRINEDGPDPQFDNDGDGRLNEDGLYTAFDDDWDGQLNEDPINGRDDDGDGLIDEDPPLPEHGPGVTTWLRPVRLDSLRNLAYLLNQRFKAGEFGGIIPGKDPQRPFMVVPSEYGFRREIADPISADYWATMQVIGRVDAEKAVDGKLHTEYGSTIDGRGGVGINLMGYYYLNRIVFRPRPTLPASTIADYYIRYGDQTTIDRRSETIQARRTLVPVTRGQFNPVVKDIRFDPSFVAGRLDVVSIDPKGTYVETAEAGYFGAGYAIDGRYTSAIIDVGTPTPRIRRYDREIEQFAGSARAAYESQFPLDVAGDPVNWGKVRWRGHRHGRDGDVRIQFRVGNTLDTHLYARRLGPGLADTQDETGQPLDLFSWIKIPEGRVPERELQYNELGVDLGDDGLLGWSFWSAPFKLADARIDESLPESEWKNAGVQLPLPGGTRYLQFRIFFDSAQHSAALLDFIEFDYAAPLVSGGSSRRFSPRGLPWVRRRRSATLSGRFSKRAKRPPSTALRSPCPARTRAWTPCASTAKPGLRWLRAWGPTRWATSIPPASLQPPAAPTAWDSLPSASSPIRTPARPNCTSSCPGWGPSTSSSTRASRLSSAPSCSAAQKKFTCSVWNDSDPTVEFIPQPAEDGDATPDIATNALLVVADAIDHIVRPPQIAPNPFTPNGDGLNDEVTFSFDLFLVLDPVDVQLEIYDLSGRRIAQLQTGGSTAGRLQVAWDGRDSRGQVAPPGIYLYRLAIDLDQVSTERSGTLSLAY